MSLFGIVGFSALVWVVVGWLVVSFTVPSPRRTLVEWLSTCGLYVALISLFGSLLTRAHEAGSTFGTLAFGFLLLLFGVGLILAVVRLFRSLGSERPAEESPTN